MDLGADQWQTFRHVTFPAIRTALLAGGLLAFALSFDEVIVTTFTTGGGEQHDPDLDPPELHPYAGPAHRQRGGAHPHPASRSSRSTSPSAWPARSLPPRAEAGAQASRLRAVPSGMARGARQRPLPRPRRSRRRRRGARASSRRARSRAANRRRPGRAGRRATNSMRMAALHVCASVVAGSPAGGTGSTLGSTLASGPYRALCCRLRDCGKSIRYQGPRRIPAGSWATGDTPSPTRNPLPTRVNIGTSTRSSENATLEVHETV